MQLPPVWRSALLGLALVTCVPPAMAASAPIARFLPRLELTAIFDLDRSSPRGTSGSRATDEASGEAIADDEGDSADKGAAATPADARRKPGGAGEQRAPRWKSLIPGALK